MPRYPKRFELVITQEDIDGAMHRDSTRCAIADAIKRSIPGAERILVDLQTIRFSIDGERRTYFTPESAARYLTEFDAGRTVKPRRFKFPAPIQVRPSGRGTSTTTKGVETSDNGKQVTKIGGKALPRVQGRVATREFGRRMYPDNQVEDE